MEIWSTKSFTVLDFRPFSATMDGFG